MLPNKITVALDAPLPPSPPWHTTVVMDGNPTVSRATLHALRECASAAKESTPRDATRIAGPDRGPGNKDNAVSERRPCAVLRISQTTGTLVQSDDRVQRPAPCSPTAVGRGGHRQLAPVRGNTIRFSFCNVWVTMMVDDRRWRPSCGTIVHHHTTS